MNLTLSADKETVEKMRLLAAQRGSSLNQMIRDYMANATGSKDVDRSASEFERLALEHGGRSEADYAFDRDEAHSREE